MLKKLARGRGHGNRLIFADGCALIGGITPTPYNHVILLHHMGVVKNCFTSGI